MYEASHRSVESPNCADAIELRGRFDAEVVGPACRVGRAPSDALQEALAKYRAATQQVTAAMATVAPERRVSGMNSHPRMARYRAMQQVHEALYGEQQERRVEVDPTLAFSCLNLSYSYDDAWDACDLEELELTAAWVYHTCLGCFGPSLVASSARVAGKAHIGTVVGSTRCR